MRGINAELIHLLTLDPSPSVLVAATSSDSDTDDEALHSSNSCYDNQLPPCTGKNPPTHLKVKCLNQGRVPLVHQVTLALSLMNYFYCK